MKRYIVTLVTAAAILFSSCGNEVDVNSPAKIQENTVNDAFNINIKEIGDFSKYDFRSLLEEDGVFSITDSDGNIGFLSVDGEILVEPKYVGAMNLSDSLVFVVDQLDNRYYIDLEENIVIDNVEGLRLGIGDNFVNGYAVVALYDSDNEVIQNNTCVIDKNGEVILRPTDQNQYFWKIDDNVYAFGTEYNSFNCEKILDLSGNELDISNFENYDNDNIYYLEEQDFYYILDNTTGVYAVYDNVKGESVTDYIYTSFIGDFGKYPVGLTYDNKYIFINNKGETILDLSTLYPTGVVADVLNDEKIVVNFNGDNTVKLIDFDGNLIKDTDFTHISYFIDGLAIVMIGDKYGYCNEDLIEVLEPIYDAVTFAYDGSGLLVKDGILSKFTLEN